jgi:glycosyltransferase involved in cell wall biosynthesis
MKNKVSLTGMILTYNNERDIENCILSIKDIVEELLVVDSFSTDRTKEICLKHGAVFIEHEFEGFIGQRNWATEQAKYDYVLAMDADEVLSPELKKSILEVKENWDCDGYNMNRLNQFCGKWIRHGSWYPDNILRLYDRKNARTVGIEPHGKVMCDDGTKGKLLKGDILHYGLRSIEEYAAKSHKYTSMFAETEFQEGKKISKMGVFTHTFWRFFRDYILRRGFLDGYYGLVAAHYDAFRVFMKYSKLYDLNRLAEEEKKK